MLPINTFVVLNEKLDDDHSGWFEVFFVKVILSSRMAENYFEQQRMFTLLCGMHSLNNILASPRFTSERLNNICYSLSDAFINPHKHIFGGDYDANVLLLALQQENCTTKWHDHRKEFVINQHNLQKPELQLIGYIINIFQGEGILNKIFRFSPRHWISVRKQGEMYCFLDSNEEQFKLLSKEKAQERIVELLKQNEEPEQRNEVIQVYKVK